MRKFVFSISLLIACAGCSHSGTHSTTTTNANAAAAVLAAPLPATEPTKAPEPRSPAALTALLAEHDRLVASHADTSVSASAMALTRVRTSIDHMAAQRDAHVSRLYWYTDLEEAKAEAKKSGRPILSLRLLGRLDEELSCANSRLFRLTLYSNEAVSKFLRDTYVLHWSSERPVPLITLDFGDGRVVKRTITGNSVHYVLDSQGRVIDALPGLYGPTAFEKGLRESLDLAKKSGDLSDDEQTKTVAKYHTKTTWVLTAQWRRLLVRSFGDGYDDQLKTASLPASVGVSWPNPVYDSLPAAVVNQLTVSKADTEAPPLALMQPQINVYSPWEGWDKLAAKSPAEHLDTQSIALITSKHPRDWSSKGDATAELDAAQITKRLARFESRLIEEQLRNEFAFHGAIHAQLSKPSRVAFESLNDFLYTKVFRTPKSDRWLGLMPTEALTGIDDDGLLALAPTK